MGVAVIVYGPTAVGKSDFAHMLAERMGGEIINADAAQLYTPLTIGTAKPDWRSSTVPYHLFDVCDEPVNYSVARYRTEAERLVADITARGKVPIFVGGSGFYIHSLIFPVGNHEKKDILLTPLSEVNWEALNEFDPARAAAIHPNDQYRIARALTLYQQTKSLPSSLEPVYRPITPSLFVELSAAHEKLKRQIAERTENMLKNGWIAETERLLDTFWEQFVLQKKWIGYPELIHYCREGKKNSELPAVAAAINRSTWQYARRQMIYGRMLVQKIARFDSHAPIKKIDLTSPTLELYLKQFTNDVLLWRKGLCNE